jgi:hypothetical protein
MCWGKCSVVDGYFCVCYLQSIDVEVFLSTGWMPNCLGGNLIHFLYKDIVKLSSMTITIWQPNCHCSMSMSQADECNRKWTNAEWSCRSSEQIMLNDLAGPQRKTSGCPGNRPRLGVWRLKTSSINPKLWKCSLNPEKIWLTEVVFKLHSESLAKKAFFCSTLHWLHVLLWNCK